jgi:PAS domain S-box-containing protein
MQVAATNESFEYRQAKACTQSDFRRTTDMDDDAQFQDLARRLAEAEQTLRAIFSGQADAVVYPVSGTPLLLHQAQEALLESEARYRGLVTRMSALVFEATPDGTLVFVNEALTPISGYRPEEVLGQNWRNLVTLPDQLSEAFELLPQLKVGDVTGYELTLRAKDGSPITLELSSANRYAADGTLQRIVGLGIDRTRHKRAEQQRDQALHDLGERVMN